MIETKPIIQLLEALAHEVRLDAFLLLIQAGPDGLAAGELTARLNVPANALSFHLTRLRYAQLVESRRQGKQVIYSAVFSKVDDLLNFLSNNCCRDSEKQCAEQCSTLQSRNAKVSPKPLKEEAHD